MNSIIFLQGRERKRPDNRDVLTDISGAPGLADVLAGGCGSLLMDLRQRPESARGEGERIEIDEASRRAGVFEAGILARNPGGEAHSISLDEQSRIGQNKVRSGWNASEYGGGHNTFGYPFRSLESGEIA